MRSQIEALGRVAADAEVKKAGAALNQKLIDLEMSLIDLRITGAQDGIRFSAKLISRFGYLANGASNADFRPIDQQLEVQKLLAERLQARLAEFETLATGDVTAFNHLLRTRNLGGLVTK